VLVIGQGDDGKTVGPGVVDFPGQSSSWHVVDIKIMILVREMGLLEKVPKHERRYAAAMQTYARETTRNIHRGEKVHLKK